MKQYNSAAYASVCLLQSVQKSAIVAAQQVSQLQELIAGSISSSAFANQTSSAAVAVRTRVPTAEALLSARHIFDDVLTSCILIRSHYLR